MVFALLHLAAQKFPVALVAVLSPYLINSTAKVIFDRQETVVEQNTRQLNASVRAHDAQNWTGRVDITPGLNDPGPKKDWLIT